MSESGPKKSERPPAEQAQAAAALGQDLLVQLQHDFGRKAEEKARVAAATEAMISKLQHDAVLIEQRKKQEAAALASALLNKVARDFGSIPPPAGSVPPARISAPPPGLPSAPPPAPGPPVPGAAPLPRFASSAPPAPASHSVTTESDAELEAAAQQSARLTAEELADLDAMTAPTGFWGKLFARFGKKKDG